MKYIWEQSVVLTLVLLLTALIGSVWFQGKMKSIYENMKNLLDPTPCFDSHICKNGSKVTSVSCYRAFEHTQVNISHTFSVCMEEVK